MSVSPLLLLLCLFAVLSTTLANPAPPSRYISPCSLQASLAKILCTTHRGKSKKKPQSKTCKHGTCNKNGACKQYRSEKASCSRPCRPCKGGLRCTRGKCVKIKPSRKKPSCKHGTCDKKGTCTQYRPENDSCARPCRVCMRGLRCTNGKCRKISAPTKKPSTKPAPTKAPVCKHGTCDSNGTCKQYRPENDSCQPPCRPCMGGLRCTSGKCVKIPTPSASPLKKAPDCKYGTCDEKGTCKKYRPENDACDPPCRVCMYNFRCSNGKCVRISGTAPSCPTKVSYANILQPCSLPCLRCKKGLRCLGRLCLPLESTTDSGKELNGLCGQCDRKAGKLCRKGLTCRPFAGRGSVCSGPKVALGGRCGGCTVCDEGTTCVLGTCVRKLACSPCGGREGGCDVGLFCDGGRCTSIVGLGAACGSGCRKCNTGLECSGGKCRKKECVQCVAQCGSCFEDQQCGNGLECREFAPHRRRCERVMREGEACEKDECKTCGSGFVCRHGANGVGSVCQRIGSEMCDACSAEGFCRLGLTCSEVHGSSLCSAVKKIGEACDAECTVCSDGLVCRDGVMCARPREEECGSCVHSGDCALGLSCVRKDSEKHGTCSRAGIEDSICKSVGTAGKCVGCVAGLFCDEESGRCKQPETKWCKKCQRTEDCQFGLVCSDGRCARPMEAGQLCRKECWACRDGMECVNGRCARSVRAEACGKCGELKPCADGLVCENGRCGRVVGKGGRCGKGCWTCEEGLDCHEGVCEGKEGSGAVCERCVDDSMCSTGLVCKIGDAGIGRCARVVEKAQRCDHDCRSCAAGLRCGDDLLCT